MEQNLARVALPSHALREIYRFLPYSEVQRLRSVNILSYKEFTRRCSEFLAKYRRRQQQAEPVNGWNIGAVLHAISREIDYRLSQDLKNDRRAVISGALEWWAWLGEAEQRVLITRSDKEVAMERKVRAFFLDG